MINNVHILNIKANNNNEVLGNRQSNEISKTSIFSNADTLNLTDECNENYLIRRIRSKRTSDGKISKVKQNTRLGDCWFLTQMNMLSNDIIGENILKNSIRKGQDSYIVDFFGVNKSYVVTAQDIKNTLTSKGDIDAKILEVAMRKYLEEILKEENNCGAIAGDNKHTKNYQYYFAENQDVMNGGWCAGVEKSLVYVLTGKKGVSINNPKNDNLNHPNDPSTSINGNKNLILNLLDNMYPETQDMTNGKMMCVAFEDNLNDSENSEFFFSSGNYLANNHAYTVLGVVRKPHSDEIKAVQLLNPANNTRVQYIDIEDFINRYGQIGIYDMNSTDSQLHSKINQIAHYN